MAIDGISLSNLGRPKESTTADLIEKTEQDAQKGEGIIKLLLRTHLPYLWTEE